MDFTLFGAINDGVQKIINIKFNRPLIFYGDVRHYLRMRGSEITWTILNFNFQYLFQ